MLTVSFGTYTVPGVETGPVHHQQFDHLESVDSHSIVHGRVSVLPRGRKADVQPYSGFSIRVRNKLLSGQVGKTNLCFFHRVNQQYLTERDKY